jgi:AraC-like DNA-binding protein
MYGQNNQKYLEFKQKIFIHVTNLDSLFYYSSRLEESKDSCLSYEGRIYKSQYFYRKGDYVSSEKIALKIAENLQNKNTFCLIKTRIESLNRLFWIKKNQSLYNSAFGYLMEIKGEIKKISKNEDYYETINSTLNVNLALIKSLLGYHLEARKILKKNLIISENNKNQTHKIYSKRLNQANILNLIGDSYLKSSIDNNSKKLDSASFYFKKAFQVAKTFDPSHEDSESLYQIREVEVLIAKDKFIRALNLIQKFNIDSKKFKTVQNINYFKAICFYELNSGDSAIYYGKNYLVYPEKTKNLERRSATIYDLLANQYYKNKQIDSAFKYSEATILTIKSLNKSKNQINKAHYLQDFEDAEKLNKRILKRNKSDRHTFIIYGIILIIISFLGVLFLYRKNKKMNTILNSFPRKQKTVYHLDEALEQQLLKGIDALKESTDYLDTSFNINVLAKKLNTNTSYLSFTINKAKNKSFKQYITELRIAYLVKRLEEDRNYRKYTIKYLAEQIGYTNASAFTRAFKKHKGIIPSDFIKSLNEDD